MLCEYQECRWQVEEFRGMRLRIAFQSGCPHVVPLLPDGYEKGLKKYLELMVLFKFDKELCIEETGRAEGIQWYKIYFFECVARCVFGERVRLCHQRSKDLVSCWDKRVAVSVSVSCLEQHITQEGLSPFDQSAPTPKKD